MSDEPVVDIIIDPFDGEGTDIVLDETDSFVEEYSGSDDLELSHKPLLGNKQRKQIMEDDV